MKRLISGLFIFTLFLATSLADGNQSSTFYELTKGLTIQVPADVKVSRKSGLEDFVIFTFTKGTNILLNAYLGNQPNFPFEKGKSIKKETINEISVECLEPQVKGGFHSREILFHLDSPEWPQRLHCWYSGLTGDEALQVNNMLSTVHIDRSHSKPRSDTR